ncbi:hypothetical protein JZG80_07285 [Staphylococcus saprophyticus]|uniref:hypothetical protein n=1 Tax=Staphylococcus saprophyticus TaxID=29385 RepID=UPI0019801B7A|nr:hypothetical protein [Staphylococcus saprophyticus]MBN6092376.1 hypothetical protein [Staphylococcus saprophyticus]
MIGESHIGAGLSNESSFESLAEYENAINKICNNVQMERKKQNGETINLPEKDIYRDTIANEDLRARQINIGEERDL